MIKGEVRDEQSVSEPGKYQPSSTISPPKKQHPDIVRLMGNKFNLTFTQLSANEILEEAIIKHARTFDHPREGEKSSKGLGQRVRDEIPDSIVITGNASWIYDSSLFPLHQHLLIDYRSLSYEQRKLLVKAYNDYYNDVDLRACTLEEFECFIADTFDSYLTGNIRNGQFKLNNLVCFPIRTFCNSILDDLKPFMHLPETVSK